MGTRGKDAAQAHAFGAAADQGFLRVDEYFSNSELPDRFG
jgi:hypothetical protein